MTEKNFFRIAVLCAVLTAIIYVSVSALHILDFPDDIILSENTAHELAFNIPINQITATIQNETVSVLKINDTQATAPVTVGLQEPVHIEAKGSGTAEMTINAFGFPVKKVTLDIIPELEVYPIGITVGVRINTNGVMVLGTGSVRAADGTLISPSEGKLRPGDLIISANGTNLLNKEELMRIIAESQDNILFTVLRDNETIETTLTPVNSGKGNMIGCWVRDSTQGIGTITYYNPETHTFGALGHGIMDVDTKKLMSVKSGRITGANITSVKKGSRGTPGELVGEIDSNLVLGQIKMNTPYGIYGVMDESCIKNFPPIVTSELMCVAKQDQVREGPATIRTNIAGNEVREYDICIESVNRYSSDETKGMVIRITDPELLNVTGGIVQGMSGSPIIQNGRLIGAITHVFVQDPAKGYGIFIENMIKQEKQMI